MGCEEDGSAPGSRICVPTETACTETRYIRAYPRKESITSPGRRLGQVHGKPIPPKMILRCRPREIGVLAAGENLHSRRRGMTLTATDMSTWRPTELTPSTFSRQRPLEHFRRFRCDFAVVRKRRIVCCGSAIMPLQPDAAALEGGDFEPYPRSQPCERTAGQALSKGGISPGHRGSARCGCGGCCPLSR